MKNQNVEVVVKQKTSLLAQIVKLILLCANILSAMVSYHYNESILWAIFHFIFGPINLIYRLLIGSFKDGNLQIIIDSYI